MRSLERNNLTDSGKDLSGVLKLAEAAKQSKLEELWCAAAPACSLVRPRPLPCAACAPVHLACRRVCCRLFGNGLTEEGKEAIRAADGTLGWWGTYIKTVEDGIFTLHDTFVGAGLPGAYGLSIFCFVLGVKLVTLPLNWQQLSSTSAMKAMKPQQDLVRKWYGDNKDMLNMQTGVLFEKFDVNPLAGCLPSLAQIPVFLGVYYSVTAIAKAKIYSEGFLWIPSLSGPIADRREGLSLESGATAERSLADRVDEAAVAHAA